MELKFDGLVKPLSHVPVDCRPDRGQLHLKGSDRCVCLQSRQNRRTFLQLIAILFIGRLDAALG